jgi:hypothetical protein
MRPGICDIGLRVAVQLENLYDSVPDRLAVESLGDRDAFNVAGFYAM